MKSGALPWPHALLALAIVAVWGVNFVVIRIALDDLPPLFLAAVRFFFAFLPAAFFLKRPAVPWRHLAAYGLLIGAGQFGLLFIAMTSHISPGLASLVIQSQVFFTIGLAMWLTKERVRGYQIAALVMAVAGIGLIIWRTDGSTSPLGLALVLVAALSWAGGNMVAKASGQVDMLAYVVWASMFSMIPLFALSFIFEGWGAIRMGVVHADWETWAAVLWQSVGNTLFGYAAWAWLLSRYSAATVSPMALLVPVFGMGASAILLGESLPAWKLAAAGLVIGGLAINLLWPLVSRRRSAAA